MNGMGLSLSEICCLFCCPPCPAKIAAKLAFLPPETTYTFEVGMAITFSIQIFWYCNTMYKYLD